jgi:hypothetical protein
VLDSEADQEAALDNLSAASSQASEIIKSSCPASLNDEQRVRCS